MNDQNNNSIDSLQTQTPCADGCGAMAKTGSSYLPGHDAKLDSMLQRYADGELEKLPELVELNLSRGIGKTLPSPRYQLVDLTIKVRVRIAADVEAPVVEAATILHKRLNVKAVTVSDVRATRPTDRKAKVEKTS